ncbi:MAG: hypothetical protein J4F29_16965, partial [Candidatus Latescibacteria bacterium]|nr:hypothetical protein [Candidatus Latescibacterota bacterium]
IWLVGRLFETTTQSSYYSDDPCVSPIRDDPIILGLYIAYFFEKLFGDVYGDIYISNSLEDSLPQKISTE